MVQQKKRQKQKPRLPSRSETEEGSNVGSDGEDQKSKQSKEIFTPHKVVTRKKLKINYKNDVQLLNSKRTLCSKLSPSAIDEEVKPNDLLNARQNSPPAKRSTPPSKRSNTPQQKKGKTNARGPGEAGRPPKKGCKSSDHKQSK